MTAFDVPAVAVQIVLDRHTVLVQRRGQQFQARHTRGEPVEIVLGEAHWYAGLLAARLLARRTGKDADGIDAPLLEDGHDRAAEARAIGQQQHHRRNPPCHPRHGDEGAPPVILHRFVSLFQQIDQHRRYPRSLLST